jgi:hypothetical protein
MNGSRPGPSLFLAEPNSRGSGFFIQEDPYLRQKQQSMIEGARKSNTEQMHKNAGPTPKQDELPNRM